MKYLKRKNQYTQFMRNLSQYKFLEQISAMKLQWLKIIPFKSDKFASYGCENYLGLSSIFKVLAMVMETIDDNIEQSFPTTDQSKWTCTINRKWLSVHGFNTKGDAKTLRDRVAHYLSNPSLLPSSTFNLLRLDHVIRMMISVYNSIKMMMADTIHLSHISQTKMYLIRALNDINKVDKHLRLEDQNPIWFKKYNLLCLLNFPNDLSLFGPTRNRWEGSLEGEKGIQLVKKEFHSFRKGFQKQIHEKVNLTQSIQNIRTINRSCDVASSDNKHNSPTNINRNYLKYKNSLYFQSKLVRKFPLSLVGVSISGDQPQ